ncbi:unnamed protein product [Rotaria sp. Silwood2]|nr:unnamed protein product [Rotaria sp. Silwood2]
MNFDRLPLKKVLKVCFIIDNKNLILFNYFFELDQEDRRKQEVETTQTMKDEDFDDSFESEDPTEKNSEFSSLRSAKFSTMALLYELHISTTQRFTYNYNRCQQQCDIYYYCTVCEDFNLCEKSCNIKPKYKHKMKCSVSPIVDMKQSYEQNSLNSTDLKSEVENKKQLVYKQTDVIWKL